MQELDFETPVRAFVEQLIAGNYQAAVDLSFDKDRLHAERIEREIKDYPGQITLPPDYAYQNIDVYPYDNGSGYGLDFALWFDNERSDLEIRVNTIEVKGKLYFTLWDILVP
jgi:hypothetical protein